MPLCNKMFRALAIDAVRCTLGLDDHESIRMQAKTFENMDEMPSCSLDFAFLVSVLYPQAELAFIFFCPEVAEKRGAKAADVQIAGRRRRESSNYSFHVFERTSK